MKYVRKVYIQIVIYHVKLTFSVNSVQWAPYQFGLMLACGSSDGAISIISSSGKVKLSYLNVCLMEVQIDPRLVLLYISAIGNISGAVVKYLLLADV